MASDLIPSLRRVKLVVFLGVGLLALGCHRHLASSPPAPVGALPPAKPAGGMMLSGHDTPIVVQGGSFKVYMSQGFDASSTRAKLVTTALSPVQYLSSSGDPNFGNAVNVVQIPSTGWTLCAPGPHYVRVAADSTGKIITVASWNPDTPDTDPIFYDADIGFGEADSIYLHGHAHLKDGQPYTGFVYSPPGSTCKDSVSATATCAVGTISKACRVNCPSSGKCYVALSSKAP